MDALPDFVALAESFGHVGIRIENPGDVKVSDSLGDLVSLYNGFLQKVELLVLGSNHFTKGLMLNIISAKTVSMEK